MSRSGIDARTLLGRLATLLRPRRLFLSGEVASEEALFEAFDAWCRVHPGVSCELALSARWVHACVPPAAAGALPAGELRAYAQRQFDHYFGASGGAGPAGWLVAVCELPQARFACAVPAAFATRLRTVAARSRVRLARMAPWWLVALPARAGDTRFEAAVEPGMVTRLVHDADGRLARVAGEFDGDAGAAVPESASCRVRPGGFPLPAVCDDPAVVAPLAAGLARGRLAEIDLLGGGLRPWPASWAALALAALAVLAAGRELAQAQDRQAEAGQAYARVASGARRHPVAPSAASSAPAASEATLRAALELAALRKHPWADVFSGVEAAAGEDVALLSLRHDAAGTRLDLDIAAADDPAAWAFVEALAADGGRFARAGLVSRDRLEPARAGLAVRARVEAGLQGSDRR